MTPYYWEMSEKKKLQWRPILLEAVFVVLGVFLALIANEWWSTVKRERAADELLLAVRSEVVRNHGIVKESMEYHWTISGRLRGALAQGSTLQAQDFDGGFMALNDPMSSAWETIQAANALPDLPVAAVLSLSKTYQQQARYREQRSTMGDVIYQTMFEEGMSGVPNRPAGHFSLLGSLMYVECGLMGAYSAAVESIDGPAFDETALELPEGCGFFPSRTSSQ
jgi:hypothetical protein